MSRSTLPLVMLCALALSDVACTYYSTLTPPPPGRVATLNSSDDEIRISRGVALGFECTTGGGNPCSEGQATVDDTKVAIVYPAYLNRLERFMEGTFTPTSYVVVGVNVGETVVRIPGEDPLRVVVVQ